MTEANKQYAGGIFKMAGGRIAAVLPNARLGAVNEREMSVPVVICTNAIDRERERILPKGITTLNHSRNPQVDFQHDSGLACGLARERINGAYTGDYTVRLDPTERLVGKTFFHQDTDVGNQVFEMVVKGALPGVSVTMLAVPNLVKKYDARDGGKPITVYEAGDLIAYSHVFQPANPECLAEIVHKGLGGKPLCRELREKCEPLVGERKAVVVSGWDSLEVIRKYLPENEPDPMQPPAPEDDPNNPVDPSADSHHAAVTDGIGTAMASLYEKFAEGVIDRATAVGKFDKLLEAHEHATDLNGGTDMDFGGEPEDDPETDDDDEDDDMDGVEGLDDDEDYEDDDKRPGKKKCIHVVNRVGGKVMCDVADELDAEAARSEYRASFLKGIVKHYAKGDLVHGLAKLARVAEDLLADEADHLVKTKGLRADMNNIRIVEKRCVARTVVVKAAGAEADGWTAAVLARLDQFETAQDVQARRLEDTTAVVRQLTES